jgi:hypothetical protein
MSPQAWQLQLALGACHAARLLAVSALALALLAFTLLTTPVGPLDQTLAALAALAFLPAIFYLGLRLEIARGLFQRLAETQDVNGDDLAALDCALEELGWKKGEVSPRPLAARVAGVVRLLKAMGGVVGVQRALIGWVTFACPQP